eukprot:7475581-Pyramimonas_sp.AAC.1
MPTATTHKSTGRPDRGGGCIGGQQCCSPPRRRQSPSSARPPPASLSPLPLCGQAANQKRDRMQSCAW